MKKYIMGLLLICWVLSAYDVEAQGLSACGGAQLYCVTTDGVVHTSGTEIVVNDTFGSVAIYGELNGNGVNNSNSMIYTYVAPYNCIGVGIGCYGVAFWNELHSIGGPNVYNHLVLNPVTATGSWSFFRGIALDLSAIDGGTISSQLWGINMFGTDQSGGQIDKIQNNLLGRTIIGVGNVDVINSPRPSLTFESVTFANLGASGNGALAYCSDCTEADPCAGAGTGSFAKRQNNRWKCN